MSLKFWISLAALGLGVPAYAYIPTVTSGGTQVHWANPKLNLAGNPANASGLSDEDFFNAVVKGLQRWEQASDGAVRFDYWQGRDDSVYIPNSSLNGLSSIYFLSHQKSGGMLSPNILGLTQVWYNSETGKILETDIVLNDLDFHFTTNPSDTSGYGSPTAPAGKFPGIPNVFIENVVTHELGHAFGLSHAGSLQSTMLFMESPEQAHLSCDEEVGIHVIYPSSDRPERGAISGILVSPSGAPIFGAEVVAISRARGTVLAAGMTGPSGNYAIAGLEPGTYFLMAEPYYAGPQPLPAYYSRMNPDVCDHQRLFTRTFLTQEDGTLLRGIAVKPGSTAQAPKMVASCEAASGASSLWGLSGAPLVYDPVGDPQGFGAYVKLPKPTASSEFKLTALQGHAEIHALNYSLYSPVHGRLELYDSEGAPVQAQTFSESYIGESGYINFDSFLVADHLPMGDYTVRFTAEPTDPSLYPAAPISLDNEPFVVLTGSVNAGPAPLAQTLPLGARCRADEVFSSYTSPPGNPPRSSPAQENAANGVGGCGTIQSRGDDDPPPSGPGAGAVAGWLLPWILMLGAGKITKLRLQKSRA